MKTLHRYSLIGILVMSGLVFLNTSCASGKVAGAQLPQVVSGDSAKRILFIGNSFTYTNVLPALVAKIGRDSGIRIETVTVAYPNYALEDHWNDGRIQPMIESGKFDFVVVQQGPSSQADGRAMLFEYGARIKTVCDKHHAKLAFFMVWPAFANFNTFDAVIKNYSDAAAATNSLLCPVGQFWKNYFSTVGDYTFYGADLFHPSLKGSENAAGIIFKTLFK